MSLSGVHWVSTEPVLYYPSGAPASSSRLGYLVYISLQQGRAQRMGGDGKVQQREDRAAGEKRGWQRVGGV